MPTQQGCGQVTIPGGTFTMGGDTVALDDTPAAGSMTVSDLALDTYDVTVARFRQFWAAGHPSPPMDPIPYPAGSVAWGGAVTEPGTVASRGDPDCTWSQTAGSLEAHPITCLDWYTAQAFCVWDGGRLPTEAEYEYVARGWVVGGLAAGRNYPWGSADPSITCPPDRCQLSSCAGDDGMHTKRVGSFPSGACGGLYDLEGNVHEWVADWYADYTDAACWNGMSRTNPVCNDSTSGQRAVRSGSWYDSSLADFHSASRGMQGPGYTGGSVGLRCARSQ